VFSDQSYSDRNARTGSIEAARRAGIIPAIPAATAKAAIAPAITFESALVMP
jgi:hypothetical protein